MRRMFACPARRGSSWPHGRTHPLLDHGRPRRPCGARRGRRDPEWLSRRSSSCEGARDRSSRAREGRDHLGRFREGDGERLDSQAAQRSRGAIARLHRVGGCFETLTTMPVQSEVMDDGPVFREKSGQRASGLRSSHERRERGCQSRPRADQPTGSTQRRRPRRGFGDDIAPVSASHPSSAGRCRCWCVDSRLGRQSNGRRARNEDRPPSIRRDRNLDVPTDPSTRYSAPRETNARLTLVTHRRQIDQRAGRPIRSRPDPPAPFARNIPTTAARTPAKTILAPISHRRR